MGGAFELHDSEGVFVEFNITHGDKWWDLTKSMQQTQTAYPDELNEVVFNHPIDLHFACGSLREWPKINFQVFKLDAHGRMDPLSVGVLCLPTTAGPHQVRCRTFSPLSERSHDDVYGYYVGGRPQLLSSLDTLDRRSGSGNPERARLVTETSGCLFLNLDIILRNWDL